MNKKQLKKRKIISVIVGVFFAVFIFFSLLLIYTLLPIKDNYKMYIVTSGSMGSKVPMGSVAVVRPQEKYKINDIITYNSTLRVKADPITHRIVGIEEQKERRFYVAKGDKNENNDQEKIISENVRGKFIFYFPYIGYIIGFAKTLPGLIILIIIPATIIIYEEIKKIKIELVNLRKQKNAKN